MQQKTKNNSPAQRMAKGIEHHQKRRLDLAAQLYRRVLKINPDQPDALHYLEVLSNQRGEPERALKLIRRSLVISPDNADAGNNLRRILAKTDDYPAAKSG